jgi:sugar lactone lactonase YvrE
VLKRFAQTAFLLAVATAASAGTARAQAGWGLAVQSDEFYFTDLTRGRVVKLDPAGRVRVLIEDVHCHNLAPGHNGRIYGEAVGTGRGGVGAVVAVWSLTTSGERAWVMPPTAQPAEGVWIARDALGNSYAWHGELGRASRIVKRTPAGAVTVLAGNGWGHADGRGSEAQFGHVGGLAVTRDGVVYVADSGHLRRISPDGSVETLARHAVSTRTGGLPGQADLFNHSMGVAVGENETVYVADYYNLRVVRWDEARGPDVILGGHGLAFAAHRRRHRLVPARRSHRRFGRLHS